MSHIADRFTVILDANVLYPFRVRDVLLRFAEAGLFRARWSQEIFDEWTRNLLKNKPGLKDSIESQLAAIEIAFPEGMVTDYEGLLPESVHLPDENDRHVIEAAIRCGAQHIITENLKDFPSDVLKCYDIYAVSADVFLASTYELYPKSATKALQNMRQGYKKPVMTQSEFIMDLMRVGLGRTAGLAREHIEFL